MRAPERKNSGFSRKEQSENNGDAATTAICALAAGLRRHPAVQQVFQERRMK
jgi:hypothetical protein